MRGSSFILALGLLLWGCDGDSSAPAASDQKASVTREALPVAPVAPRNPDGLNRGDPAADFKGEVVYGGDGELTLSQFVGIFPKDPKDGAIVAFGASWCGYCKASLPTLKALQAEHDNLKILYIGTDDNEAGWEKEIALFKAQEMNIPLIRVPDPGALVQTYFGNKRNLPRFYLVDNSGVIRLKDQGFTVGKMGKMLPRQVTSLLNMTQEGG